jgi:hypothetical protein
MPDEPVPYCGWGDLPDQYGRRWDGDDGESIEPKRPALHSQPSSSGACSR